MAVTASCSVGAGRTDSGQRACQASLSSRTALSLASPALRFPCREEYSNSSRSTWPKRHWASAEESSKVSINWRSRRRGSPPRLPAAGAADGGPQSGTLTMETTLSGNDHTAGSASVATRQTRWKS
jgi:hypothetical protein